ncbi:MAG: hypothetical protein EHM89_09160 [Acidobacteria bacterium]|nr:MAG: hypothetical protein EHM89_09160 [Acidobacteriota bacterium]
MAVETALTPAQSFPPTTLTMRVTIAAAAGALGIVAYFLAPVIGPRGQAGAGAICFILIVAAVSLNLHAVNWRTVGFGLGLQLLLAVLILKFEV